MREVIGIIAGLALWALLYWLMAQDTSTPHFLPLAVIDLLSSFYATIFPMLLWLLPAALCGALARRAPLLCGALVGASSGLAGFLCRADWAPPAGFTWAFGVAVAGIGAGAAGAALGVLLARSNKSFKPNPLRGSA